VSGKTGSQYSVWPTIETDREPVGYWIPALRFAASGKANADISCHVAQNCGGTFPHIINALSESSGYWSDTSGWSHGI